MLAAGDVNGAEEAVVELERLAGDLDSAMLAAMAAQARGATELAQGEARAALGALRRAADAWRGLSNPYEAGRVRELIGHACRELGDEDTARLELDAARAAFTELEAADLSRLDLDRGPREERHGLSGRELEVLRLVAAGKSNREIATALSISEHTVARHLQNIFSKLGVSSRTAASAFAFSHDLA